MGTIYAIGGGELKTKETLTLDSELAKVAKKHAAGLRARALFIPTASRDHLPYYNSFHKIYTGVFDIKTDVVLSVNKELDPDKTKAKFDSADLIYIGGGNTLFMIESFIKTGLLGYIKDALDHGTPIAGISAGAVLWFDRIFTDSLSDSNLSICNGLGLARGLICPHYNRRKEQFDRLLESLSGRVIAIEDLAMIRLEGSTISGKWGEGDVYYSDAIESKKLKKII
ncbi:MAG: Type 1 glutamine amidotransferase-like domain-containing protein [Clostridia bacterium]|nr:Type 1 glutamine amidotransferase-like domain-containing protein [Clostridia bacterium]